MADERVRIEVAFESGQVVSAQVERAVAEQLERALGSGDAQTFTLETEEGPYTIALRKVTYVKRSARESRIGFGEA